MRKRNAQALQGEDRAGDSLIRIGKQLLSSPRGSKDVVVKLLKVRCGGIFSAITARTAPPCRPGSPERVISYPVQDAAKVLEEAPQNSQPLKLASGEVCKALSKPELLGHRDKVGTLAILCFVTIT